jgi:tetratricopeptide (TPR) repeat protein
LKRTLSALVVCVALAACKHEGGGVLSDAGAAFRPSPRPTTQSSGISINNLDGEIADARERMARGEAFFRHRLPDSLLERASYLGTTADYDEADSVSLANLASEPNDAGVLMTRAHVLSALHRFADALATLDDASAHKAPADDVKRARATIFLATGRCAEAAPIWSAIPYSIDMAARGAMEQRLGHPQLAETLFERGRMEYGDVSPMKLAWMDFERARAFEREDQNQKARAYLEDALEAFPEYAHAAVHAAGQVSPERAIKMLEIVEKRADDPDVFAAHADALRRARRDAEARVMTDRAKTRMEEVLAKHPEAFADHAARFFLGAGGDVKRALELAKGAASRAPSEETLELWLRAARANNASADVCAAIKAADATTCPLRGSRPAFDEARKSCK